MHRQDALVQLVQLRVGNNARRVHYLPAEEKLLRNTSRGFNFPCVRFGSSLSVGRGIPRVSSLGLNSAVSFSKELNSPQDFRGNPVDSVANLTSFHAHFKFHPSHSEREFRSLQYVCRATVMPWVISVSFDR